ncbi:hypothetical protein [Aestuariivirga sp.]|uniref:hypothetical protein n=1 Tax=Aestuariivirga sp. TaxID=2650926 RepID=UPI0037835BBB
MFAGFSGSRSLVFAISALVLMSMPNVASADDVLNLEALSNKSATGDELISAFFALASTTGSSSGVVGTTAEQDVAARALAKPYLDSAFQLQRSSGERYVADTYQPSDVDDVVFGDVRETRPTNDVMVVRYSVRANQSLPDSKLVMSPDKAPRLTVFHWSDTDSLWKVLSHANFNTPVAAICDQEPIIDNNLASPAGAEDQALGEALMTKFYDLLLQGDAAPLLHPLFQYQNANGVGYTTLAERKRTTKLPQTTFERAVVTRNGDLLVVSDYNTAKERVLMGQYALRGGKSSHLATFQRGNEGTWRMISLAAFMPAKSLPEGAACVSSGKLEDAPL